MLASPASPQCARENERPVKDEIADRWPNGRRAWVSGHEGPVSLLSGPACARLPLCIGGVHYTHSQSLPMRTNIDISDDLMAEALEATGLRTKREVVEAGL